MPVILVAERDASRAERISEALRLDDLSVTIAASRAEALSIAGEHTPSLLLASSALPEVSALLADFSRRGGGPGAVLMVEVSGTDSAAGGPADEILSEPFSDAELRDLVRRCLKPATEVQGESTSGDTEQLTSADIFGDMLAEVEAEARSARPAAAARKPSLPLQDIERRLEETLSGVLPTAGKGKRARPGRREKGRKRQPELPTDTEIDDLLDQTLSSLDISTRSRKPPAPRAPGGRPEVPPPPAAPSAPPAAGITPASAPESPGGKPVAPLIEPKSEPAPSGVAGDTPATGQTGGQTVERVPGSEDAVTPEAFQIGKAGAGAFSGGFVPSAAPVSFAPPEREAPAANAPVPLTALDDLQSEANQFRTQALPVFDPTAETAGGDRFGDYTLLDRIATGGMAEVWRARRRGVEGFQKTVAIKKILSHLTGSQDFVTMFIDEAKLAAQLSHNNIIQIYDLGKVGDDFFIAMEYVDGKDLRSILTSAQESKRPIPLGLGLLIVSAVAQALDYAHRKRDFEHRAMGLVHRDVSPQNVLISFEGAIKLCDFGIVKAVAKASTTQMGALKGKLQYMSPEQAWGKSVDARSDIFSLGSVLYEVLTGTQLFAGESEIGVLDAVRECRISSPRELVPEIPEAVARIALKALTKSPDERYQTAGELEQEIRSVLDSLRPAPSQKDLASYLYDLFELPRSGAVATVPGSAAAVSPAPPADLVPAAGPGVAQPVAEKPDTGQPERPDGDATPSSGRWKWLAAAVLAAVLAGAGWLALPSLWRREAQAPVAPPPPQIEDTAPPAVSPAPLEDATAASRDDPTGETDIAEESGAAGAESAAAAEDPAAADETAAEPGSAVTAAGIDIEQMVNEELTSRAEQLRRDFEAEKRRIEQELAKTQQQNPPPVEDGKPPVEDGKPPAEDGKPPAEDDQDEGGNGRP